MRYHLHNGILVPDHRVYRAPVRSGQMAVMGRSRSIVSSAFAYYSAVFDGSNDYLSRGADLTGVSDGKTGLLSFWIKMGAGSSDTGTYYYLTESAAYRLYVSRQSNGRIRILGRNSSNTLILDLNSNANSCIIASGWVHVLASWDLTTTAYIYINGVNQTTLSTRVDDNIDYTGTNWNCGSSFNGVGKHNGLLSEFYFTTEWLDISVEANRLKFRTAGGKPENLGANGSTPTGTQPLIYLRNQVPNWHTNVGSGGGFTENGTLDDGGADIP